jgi:hypothetical protein
MMEFCWFVPAGWFSAARWLDGWLFRNAASWVGGYPKKKTSFWTYSF